MSDTLYIVMPAYNEQENIGQVVAEWHPICERLSAEGHDARLLIANDGSRDGTLAKLLELQASHPFLTPVDKPNSGHGATLMLLYRRAVTEGATYVFQTDSDGQTRPEEFWEMWERRADFELQIGTRDARQDGFSRVVVTKVLRVVVWLMFHVWVKDANTPFRLMRAETLSALLEIIPEDYNLTNVAVAAIATRRRCLIRWQPITFRARQGGVNSINLRRICGIGAKALSDFWQINRKLDKE